MKSAKQIRKMSADERAKFWNEATPAQVEFATVKCYGEAHENAHIDNCLVCLKGTWGRMLKPD